VRFIQALAVPLFAALGGCAHYSSQYQAPADGRARVLFNDTHAVMSVSLTTDQCLAAAGSQVGRPAYGHSSYGGGGGGAVVWWVPPPIVHVHSGPGPSFGPGPRVAAHPFVSGVGSSHGGHMSGGGGGSGGKGGEAYIVLAVVLIIASPIVAYGLSFSRAESEDEVSATIDRVNAYNDLSRWPGSPCTPEAP
jgi:hypothetical protein